MIHTHDRVSYLKLSYTAHIPTSFDPLTKRFFSSHFQPKTQLGRERFALAFSLARPSKTL